MKIKVLLACALLLCSLNGFSQRSVRIGYVDMEYILDHVEEYRQATEQLEKKVQLWKQEVELKQSAIERMKQELLAEKVLLTEELIAEREEEIRFLEKEMLDYQQDRFGPKGDLVMQKQLLIQPIQDQVFNEIQKIGANKRYDFIFDRSADVVMLYSEKRHDVSDLVLREISRTRKISPSNRKQEQQDRLDRFMEEDLEEEETISEALLERQQRADSLSRANAQEAQERRAEQLRLREERKKAYEARRQKLLEEREAKRDTQMEERKKAQEVKKDSIDR